MTDQPPHPALDDLLQRLEGWALSLGRHRADREPERMLVLEAVAMLKRQAAVNEEFHRRVQKIEGAFERESKIAKLKGEAAFLSTWAVSSAQRMSSSNQELKQAYEETLRVNPDGFDCYHSVMDIRCDGGKAAPGQIWANRMSRKGKASKSVRVVDAVKRLADEVLALREKSK